MARDRMTYSSDLWPMIVAAICALLWILLGVIIMIALKSEKNRKIKHMKRAAKRRKKLMEKRAKTAVPFGPGPVMYPPGMKPHEVIVMNSLPRNRPRDTPKVVPLEDDIIYDNKRSSSEIRRDDGESRREA